MTLPLFQTKLLCVKELKHVSFLMQKAYPLFLEDSGEFEGEIGGAELDLYVIATELARHEDFHITFYTGDFGQEDMIRITDNLILRKFRYWNEKEYPRWHHKILRRLCCIWILLRDGSEVFFSEAHGELWGYVVLVRKFLMRKRTVYRIASDLDLKSLREKGFDIHDLIFAFGFKFTDFIIAQNSVQQRMLESKEGRKSTEIKNALRDMPIAEDIVHRKRQVLWVGRCIPLKQPLKFVELARSMPEERFVMISPGKGELKREVIQKSEHLENLKVIDFVNPKRIQENYNQAKCLVSTSTAEGFPNSFVQAFMGGTPVVSLHVNPDGIFTKYDIGRCCHGDLPEAEVFIRSLARERMEQLYTNCRGYFKENHDISQVIEKYKSLFASIYHRTSMTS